MTIDFHQSSFSPFCRSVRVLAKRIGVDLNLVDVKMEEGQHKTEPYLELNPFHTIPILEEDGFKLFESRAIMTYLVSKYAPDSELYPKDLQQRALVDAMLNTDAGSLAAIHTARVKSILYTGKDLGEAAIKHGDGILQSLDLLLSKRKYAAGDSLTVADIAIVHTLALAEVLGVDLSQYSHVAAYFKKVRDDLGEVYREINDEVNVKAQAHLKSKKAE